MRHNRRRAGAVGFRLGSERIENEPDFFFPRDFYDIFFINIAVEINFHNQLRIQGNTYLLPDYSDLLPLGGKEFVGKANLIVVDDKYHPRVSLLAATRPRMRERVPLVLAYPRGGRTCIIFTFRL